MKLIVGLGNPGRAYESTRHNVGFILLDRIAEHFGALDFSDSKHKGVIAQASYRGEKILLLKPMTYMNLSGESVSSVVNFYKIPLEDILIISDDIDMEFGKIRLREGGSSGGQNGLKSIESHLVTQKFSRLKVGIGRDARYSVSDWVLSQFLTNELHMLSDQIAPLICEKVTAWCLEPRII